MEEFLDSCLEDNYSNVSVEDAGQDNLSCAQTDYMEELKINADEWESLPKSLQTEQIGLIKNRFAELESPILLDDVFEEIYGKEMYESYLKLENNNIEAPGDLEQIDKISDLLSECQELQYENWIHLTDTEKADVINNLEEKIAEVECRPSCPISFENLGEPDENGYVQMGGYRPDYKDINLNECLLANSPECLQQVLDTVIHEGRHAYQDFNLHELEVHPRHSEVESWSDTWGDEDGKWEYMSDCSTELGLRLYEQQSIEIDARNFAGDVLNSYTKKLYA